MEGNQALEKRRLKLRDLSLSWVHAPVWYQDVLSTCMKQEATSPASASYTQGNWTETYMVSHSKKNKSYSRSPWQPS